MSVSETEEELITAVKEGNLIKVENIINTDGLSKFDSYYLLCYATRLRHPEIAKFLLFHDCVVNTDNYPLLDSPLRNSVNEGLEEIVKILLDKEAQVDDLNVYINKETPLLSALKRGHKKILTLLIEAGADLHHKDKIKRMYLHHAISEAAIQFAEFLVTKNLDVNAADYKNVSALQMAIEKRNLPACKLLISSGADLNKTDNCGMSPLHVAAESGDPEIVSFLLENNADVFMMSGTEVPPRKATRYAVDFFQYEKYGWRPLHAAVINQYLEIIEKLMNYEIYRCVEQNTPHFLRYDQFLALSLMTCGPKIVHIFLKHCPLMKDNYRPITIGVMANVRGKEHLESMQLALEYGLPSCPEALRLAVFCSDFELTKLLLEWGTELRWSNRPVVNKVGRAKAFNILKLVIKYKRQYFRKVFSVDDEFTPLDEAVVNKKLDILKLIVQYEENSFHKDDVLRALSLAYWTKKVEIVQLLLDSSTNLKITSEDYFRFYTEDRNYGSASIQMSIIHHVIKLKEANLLSEGSDSTYQFCTSDPFYQEQCYREISKMKNDKIGDSNITFYEILSSSIIELKACLENESVKDLHKTHTWKLEYPAYQSIMCSKLSSASTTINLYDDFEECSHRFPLYFSQPLLCKRKIRSYLSLGDLRRMINISRSDVETVRIE